MAHTKARERGATLLMVTFVSTFLLIPIIGTCIDGAVLYWVKARLSAAVDAAALATARSLNVGQTVTAQECNATQIGANYFTANFPTGVMRTTLVGTQSLSTCPGNTQIVINETILHKRIVTVSVSVNLPTFFMKILGFNNSTVSATGQATRRDSNIMLVLDRSNSMNQNGSCAGLISSAENFVTQFVEGRDQLGLVTYQSSANVDFPPSTTFKSGLKTALDSLICNGDTSTAQGLHLAYNQIQTVINQPGALNVILLFTDGQPNTIYSNQFAIKTQVDNRYGVANTSQVVSTPKSSCPGSALLTGAIADGTVETASDLYGLNTTGDTYSLFSAPAVAITTWSGINPINAPGCSFTSDVRNGRQDIQAIPTTDAYQNSTVDGGYIPLDYFPSGPYQGLIRPDMPRTVRWAAMNTTDSMAQTIRNDATYTPVIYAIGLQGNEPMAIDQDFMKRLANDPTTPAASNYDSTKAQGKFILATNTAQLAQAFQQIASQILRLSQ